MLRGAVQAGCPCDHRETLCQSVGAHGAAGRAPEVGQDGREKEPHGDGAVPVPVAVGARVLLRGRVPRAAAPASAPVRLVPGARVAADVRRFQPAHELRGRRVRRLVGRRPVAVRPDRTHVNRYATRSERAAVAPGGFGDDGIVIPLPPPTHIRLFFEIRRHFVSDERFQS